MGTMKSVFFNGMNISSLTSKYCENVEEELSKVAIGDDEVPEMEDILAHFNTINLQLKDKMYKEKAEDVFRCIPMKMELFYDKFDKECMKIPIFKYYDCFQMFQRISCATNEDIVTIKEKLVDRANLNKNELVAELPNMKKLKGIMDDYIDGKQPSIKLVILQDFSNGLADIISKYESTNEDKVFVDEEKVVTE